MKSSSVLYSDLSDQEVTQAIWRAKETLGPRLTILGHHYQRDEVIQFADYRGDSLGLSQQAAAARDAQYIVFCGVSFMAETAAILSAPGQVVMQPVLEALCPMAHMANSRDAEVAWGTLSPLFAGGVVPITYQNSTADVKAFVGRHGGAVCTSSNAQAIFRWALARGEHILFLPDEHLGTNTALDLGIPREQVVVWDPSNPPAAEKLAGARVSVWKGYCNVHRRMLAEDVDRMRAAHPGALVVVHPECRREVVEKADADYSTTGIIRYVEKAPVGATIIVGTEINLVERLALQHPDKTVLPLVPARCATMSMTTARDLLYILEGLLADEPRNVITVDDETARWAKVALDTMLEMGANG